MSNSKRVAGRYQLMCRVGAGNMSTVYEAEDVRRRGHIVAVKLLNTEHDDAPSRNSSGVRHAPSRSWNTPTLSASSITAGAMNTAATTCPTMLRAGSAQRTWETNSLDGDFLIYRGSHM